MKLRFDSSKTKQSVLCDLKRGLKLLTTKGWCQNAYSKIGPDGHYVYCASGSIHAGRPLRARLDTFAAFQAGIKQTMPGIRLGSYPEADCIRWNDRKGRTSTQVKQAFRAAIKLAERAKVQ